MSEHQFLQFMPHFQDEKSEFVEAIESRATRAADLVCMLINQGKQAEILAEGSDIGVLLKVLSEAALMEKVREQFPLLRANIRGIKRRQAMIDEAGGALTVKDAADLLGVTRQAVEKRAKGGGLLTVSIGSLTMIPAFQLAEGCVLPGLKKVINAFKVEDSWMRLNFFLTKDSSLGGRTPAEALKAGLVDEVEQAAAAYGEHGGR